jgi:hypothetical protein
MTCFECINGVAYSHFSSDACSQAMAKTPQEEFEPFKGKVVCSEGATKI